LSIVQRLWRSLQQRVCSGFSPDSLFTVFPVMNKSGTKIEHKGSIKS